MPTPAHHSAALLREIAVFRHGPAPAAAREHAAQLQPAARWSFELHDTLAPMGPEPLAESPAGLSALLLDLLAGRHPRTRQPLRPAGLTVSEASWDDWLQAGGSLPAAKA